MATSLKHKGSDTILYNAVKGTAITTGTLADNSWFKIKAIGVASALPAGMGVGYIFQSPKNTIDAITLATGDEVFPLTLTEICKADISISGEMGTIDTTDSCDYPYMANIPDGYTNLSGSINTMMRFDEVTHELITVTKDLLVKFFDIVADSGTGVYSVTPKDDSDLLFMVLLNKDQLGVVGTVANYLIIPAILNSIANDVPLKDALKANYNWTKGEGPASYYARTEVA